MMVFSSRIIATTLLLAAVASACQVKITCLLNGKDCNSPGVLTLEDACIAALEVFVTFEASPIAGSAASSITIQEATLSGLQAFDVDLTTAAAPSTAIVVPANQGITFLQSSLPFPICGKNKNIPPLTMVATIRGNDGSCSVSDTYNFRLGQTSLCLPEKGGCFVFDDFCCSGKCLGPTMGCEKKATTAVGFGCFSGDATVQRLRTDGTTAESIAMKDLKIGDYVKTANTAPSNYERVYSFGHYHPTVKDNFVQIHFDDGHHQRTPPPLELTSNHLVWVNEKEMIPASAIRVGDFVSVVGSDDHSSRSKSNENRASASAVVRRITTITKRGVYAPFTASGTIVVNNIVASTFVTLNDDSAVVFTTLIGKMSLSWHWMAQLLQGPHQFWCNRIAMDQCVHETYTADGLSTWSSKSLSFALWLLDLETTNDDDPSKKNSPTTTTTVVTTLKFTILFPSVLLILGIFAVFAHTSTTIVGTMLVLLLIIIMRLRRHPSKRVN